MSVRRRTRSASHAARCTAGSNGMVSKATPRHERRVFWLALAGGFPAVALALGLLWFGDFTPRTQWTLTLLVAGVWVACAGIVREHVVRPLQTVSNVLAALRERDYTLRARGSNPEDALGLLLLELNSLGDDLRAQRLGALEATALLRRVMEEIDVAIFAFDATHALRLVNRSGAALLGRAPEQLLGRDAASLGLAGSLSGDAPRVDTLTFPGRAGRWEVRRGTFRQGGLPHQLLVLTDVSRALSEEERQAWKRLIRVLSHELNNSLAPIKSIADSLLALITLVRNAVDATLEANGAVEIGWETRNGQLDVWVRDEGAGLADTANLFVPFYTTKPDGSGIGLALSRQIAEAHGGTLTLSNQVSGQGCEARFTLPMD